MTGSGETETLRVVGSSTFLEGAKSGDTEDVLENALQSLVQ